MVFDNDQSTKISDAQMIERAKINPDDFQEIVSRYYYRLFGYLKRTFYFSHEDLEDLLQEIFIKVYRFINDYDETMAFSTWIYQIARNCAIDEIRKRKSRPTTVSLEPDETLKFFRSGIDLEADLIMGDQLKKIKEIIQQLPLKYREALILRFLEEKSYEEIMDILQKPKGTVAALISRGRELLKNKAIEQGMI